LGNRQPVLGAFSLFKDYVKGVYQMGKSRDNSDSRPNRARRTRKPNPGQEINPDNGGSFNFDTNDENSMGGTTGRYLVLFNEGASARGLKALSDNAGFRVSNLVGSTEDTDVLSSLGSGEALVFEDLGVAVVDTPPDQLQALGTLSTEDNTILAIEPERIVYAFTETEELTHEDVIIDPILPALLFNPELLNASSAGNLPVSYLLGYRDAVNHLVEKLLGASGATLEEGLVSGTALSEAEFTWGLQLTKVNASRFSGKGIKVAVLDTGFDVGHPDFVGRKIVTKSFIQGETVQDRNGHGTHCIGTACGPKKPGRLPRYGVAYNAEIYVGKVLSNRGSGNDSGILAAIQWAISNGCAIVSMSLGAPLSSPRDAYSTIFETVARRALAAGTLIIAAAGNDSERPHLIKPVSHPANCPSIMAVAALDQNLQVAAFSNGGLNVQGGQVDIAGPGVNVRSSWFRPTTYRTISGTSMATPHVAGIAALLAEANPGARGRALASLLTQSARRLVLPSRDTGAGLVQAP
jgi:subtilisin family serine protease